jgi:hypothetical protein
MRHFRLLIAPVVLVPAMLVMSASAMAVTRRPPPSRETLVLFDLVNRTSQPVRELFAVPAGEKASGDKGRGDKPRGDKAWGRERLDGKAGVPAGGRYAVRRHSDSGCVYDLRVVFADGRIEDRRGVDICASHDVVLGEPARSTAIDPISGKPADDPSFKLFNRAAIPITELFAVPSGVTDWGRNRLSDGPLPPDGKFLVSLPADGNCFYDLRAVFSDNQAKIQKHTDLCRFADVPLP